METARQRTLRLGARLGKQAVVAPLSKPAAARSITLSIDGGHVRAARQYQRLFEFENVRLRFTDDALEFTGVQWAH